MKLSIYLIIIITLSGCARLDPEIIQAGGNDYNIAIQHTRDEQMLLNLIRLKYRDTPFFMEVGSVSSQFRLSSGASLNANLKEQQIPENIGIGGNINFIEQPTVTYTPLQGDNFVQRLLAPVSIDTILLLANSGWSLERVWRLSIQTINDIPNAPTASGPTPVQAPVFKEFLDTIFILSKLYREGKVSLGYTDNNPEATPVLLISKTAKDDAGIIELRKKLGLNTDLNQYTLVFGTGKSADGQSIVLSTRSLMGIMFYLSHSVIVPDNHKQAGTVTITKNEDGTEFDWTTLTKDLFRIETHPDEVPNYSIGTRYRGHWFYIKDSDLDTKSTFSLLAQLFSLQAGKAEGLTPVLTLPVGQ